jgi:hypothetical protein
MELYDNTIMKEVVKATNQVSQFCSPAEVRTRKLGLGNDICTIG